MRLDKKKTVCNAIFATFCLLLSLSVASCSTLGLSKDEKGKEVLTESVQTFNQAFKWEDYSSAAIFIPASKKELFWQEAENFKGKIRIIDFQIRDIDHVEKAVTAAAIVNCQIYRTSSPILESVTFTQNWYFDETQKGWMLSKSGFQAMTKKPGGL